MKTKAIFLLWMLLLVSSTAEAQSYQPLLSDNAVWTTMWGDAEMGWWGEFAHAKYQVMGDSVLNGTTYHRCYVCDDWTVTDDCWQFLALLREDVATQRVYVVPYGTEIERLLYDFSLSVGDIITVYTAIHSQPNCYVDPPEASLMEVIQVDVDGAEKKHLYLRDTWTNYVEEWLEGTGSTSNGLFFPGFTNHIWLDGPKPSLICQEESGDLRYLAPQYTTCPTTILSSGNLSVTNRYKPFLTPLPKPFT